MGRYASTTEVSSEKSIAEIKKLLQSNGATAFGYSETFNKAMIYFELYERQVRFTLPLPSQTDDRFTTTAVRGNARSDNAAYKAWEQECRSLWRRLKLAILAKIEVINAGISTFDSEFLAHIVMPNGRTIGEEIIPQIEQAYDLKGDGQLLLEGKI